MKLDQVEEVPDESVFSGDGGMPERVYGGAFQVKFLVDRFNGRLNILDYGGDIDELAEYFRWKARAHELTKISLRAKEADWESFIPHGYVMEGILKYFFSGEDAYYMGRFLTRERRFGEEYDREDAIMRNVRREPEESTPADEAVTQPGTPIEAGEFQIETAGPKDAGALAELYERVFDTYPTPMNRRAYIEKLMANGSHFRLARTGGEIAAAASAAVDPDKQAAEMTDCATLSAHRGKGLMRHLLSALERDLTAKPVGCLFGTARSLSHGMNLIFRKLGYTYQGRLANHCHIMGGYEDMNLWVKRASPSYMSVQSPGREESYSGPGIP